MTKGGKERGEKSVKEKKEEMEMNGNGRKGKDRRDGVKNPIFRLYQLPFPSQGCFTLKGGRSTP